MSTKKEAPKEQTQREPLEVLRMREIRNKLDKPLLDEYIEIYNKLLANFISNIKINMDEPGKKNND